jgi:hypothetical protein
MSKSSFMRNAFISTLAAVGAMTAANDATAQSLAMGQCYTPEHVLATRQIEGQFTLVSARRPIPEQPLSIFTSNPTGSFGYRIEDGTGEDAGKKCIMGRYTDVMANPNIEADPIPSWALIGQNTPHNRWLENQRRQTDERVVLGATALRTVNGQDLRGAFMMLTKGSATVSTIQNTGAITLSFSNGEIRPSVGLVNITPDRNNYDRFINRPTQVAALTNK